MTKIILTIKLISPFTYLMQTYSQYVWFNQILTKCWFACKTGWKTADIIVIFVTKLKFTYLIKI